MSTIDHIKEEIRKLYEIGSDVHITVRLTHPKIIIDNTPAKIVGVYKNIFQIVENDAGYSTRHTVRYGDVLIGLVSIAELGYR